jgi:oligoendopeptidase F
MSASPQQGRKTQQSTAAATAISGPPWRLTDEYASIDAVELEEDIRMATESMDRIAFISKPIAEMLPKARNLSLQEVKASGLLPVLEEVNKLRWDSSVLMRNVYTYANCIGSVDGSHEAAKRLVARMSELFARHTQALQPASLFLEQVPDEVADAYLALSAETGHNAFLLGHSRKLRDHLLSLEEENMLSAYEVPGIKAWGTLYTDLSATIKVRLEQPGGTTKVMGGAAAAGLLDNPDEAVRKCAWLGIKQAWLAHTETCAAVLNAITAWRKESQTRRRLEHFLDPPLHLNRMSQKSLNALLEAVNKNGEVGRKALRIQAAALGKPRLEPWDLTAPAPVSGTSPVVTYTFDEGIEVIANAVGAIDQGAGDFVRMMQKEGWIEATRGDAKRPGAYCTGFAKSRNPRVYLSEYNGRAPLLLTLAHELGHAYHSWVMRDMPRPETSYPMNLAETASIFFETVVAADLLKRANSTEEKFAITWNNAQSAATFLLNIPARFKFENDLNVRRPKGKLSAAEIDSMMVDAWKEYYKGDVDRLDEVGIFSATKLHFYISTLSFYNFPYTFGWLFSLGVLAQRDRVGADSFGDMYRSLLRDTGRLTAEEVVEKHIGGKITETEFWNRAIDLVRQQVDEFEGFAAELGHVTK